MAMPLQLLTTNPISNQSSPVPAAAGVAPVVHGRVEAPRGARGDRTGGGALTGDPRARQRGRAGGGEQPETLRDTGGRHKEAGGSWLGYAM